MNDKPDQTAGPANDLTTSGRELYDLLVAYTRQETTEPLRGLGRYIGFGAAGSILISLGSTLLVVGVLRLLQTETDTTFTGNWSWVPYLLALVFAAAIIAVAVRAVSATTTPGEKAARDQSRTDRKED